MSYLDDLKKKAQSAYDTAKKVGQTAKNTYEAAANTAKNVYNAVNGTAKNVYNAVNDTTRNVYNAVNDTTKNIYNAINGTPNNVSNNPNNMVIQQPPIATPKQYSTVDLSRYGSGYKKSDSVLKAEQNKANAENALLGYGDFEYSKQGDLSGIMDKILNREEFKYDLNGDALYKQYADKYITQGKMASQDVAGQAAAMTGGYGNSYAAAVGNSAYQQSLQQLNDVIPELQQLAYDRYAQEGQDLLNQYSLLSADKNTEYGMWGDKRNQLIAERDYAANAANDAYARDYGEFNDAYNRDFSRYWQETQFGYGQERDAAADAQWQQNFDYAKERDVAADAQWRESFDYGKLRDEAADAQWRESFEYGKEQDKIANEQWRESFDYAANRDAIADAQWRESFDYGKQRDEAADKQWRESFDYGKSRDEIADAQWRESFDYAANRDAIADAQWRESFDYGKQRDEAADKQWRESFDYGKEQDKIRNDQWDKTFNYQSEQDKIRNDQWDKTFDYGVEQDKIRNEQWQQTFDYGAEQDKIRNEQWDKSFNEGVRQFDENMTFNKEQADASDAENARNFAYGQAMNAIQSGVMPSEDVLKSAGIDEKTAESMIEAYKNSGSSESGSGGSGSSLNPTQWAEINENCEVYAEMGSSQLKNYVNGLVNRGWISADEAADLYEQYFKESENVVDTTVAPTTIEPESIIDFRKKVNSPYTYSIK